MLSIVVVEDFHLEQLDVKATFFHGNLKEDFYMHHPQGHAIARKEGMVSKLKRSLYGLKRSLR